MADSDSDSETDRLESALDALFVRHCRDPSAPNSKDYCTEFCALVEEHTGRWQVPLPQLKVLRTALCSFTNATAAFPDDCQHMRYALSSLALSYFELMLFFSKEEFVEAPMKEILDSFQECHLRLLRHRNAYFAQVRQTIKAGGPWESPVLQGIMRAASLTKAEVDEYLSSEVPAFLELRVRYLQACERVQEAMALTKRCLDHSETGKHHYFQQAYLICLYKASLHEHLHKEYHLYLNAHMAELDGRDAVEIICNTENVEKGDVLLAMSKAFLNQQLHNGDMYYIWDLVFIWSKLHLRAHPSRQEFLAECRQMASSASNVRAIFPFIKVVTAELGHEGVQFCVELCAHALQQCDLQADPVTYSLVCKTVAFLLPGDQEVCRACSLLVFCQERSLEAYRTVCQLHMHPDEELHPYISPIPTNVRFHVLQILKEGLCFDPEFWNLLTLRTHCLELFSDKALKAAILSEMEAEEEKENQEMLSAEERPEELCPMHSMHSTQTTPLHYHAAPVRATKPADEHPTRNVPETGVRVKRKRQKKVLPPSDDEADVSDDPEIKVYDTEYDPEIKFYGAQFKASLATNNSQYSLRRKCTKIENSVTTVKLPPNRQREYLSRCVKNNILKRKGRKKRWLQGISVSESAPGLTETKVKVKVKVKGKGKWKKRKTLQRLELSYPENEVYLEEEDYGILGEIHTNDGRQRDSQKENDLEMKNNALIDIAKIKEQEGERLEADVDESTLAEHVRQPEVNLTLCEDHPPSEPELPARTVESDPELSEPLAFELLGCPVELFHNYALNSKTPDDEAPSTEEAHAENGDAPPEEKPKVKVKKSWKEKMLQSQRYCHVLHHCILCQKDFKGLNVLRHALAHLKKNKLRCILCGKWFRQLPFAKKHIMDHIDTMSEDNDNPSINDKGKLDSKDKSSKNNMEKLDNNGKPSTKATDGSTGNEPDSEVNPVNGTLTDSENVHQDGDQDQPSSPSQQQKSKKNNLKTKPKPELSRESRIIRNLRINIRKLHRNGNTTFTDEQVIISEDLVVVTLKDHNVSVTEQAGAEEGKEKQAEEMGQAEAEEVKEKQAEETGQAEADEMKEKQAGEVEEPEGAEEVDEERAGETQQAGAEEAKKQQRAGENGYGGLRLTYNLCPSENCDKLFAKLGPTIKHALKYHASEDRVLEKTFVWSNHKCLSCQRKMQFLQQYKDHMKLHDDPLRNFCCHVECSMRFLTQQELKDHIASHNPFRPQCSYAGCQQQFSLIQGLYDHEWRHYTPAPQKEDMTIGPNRRKTQSDEAPWKQRVKIEETWTQGGKGQKGHYQEISKSGLPPETDESEPQGRGENVSDPGGDQNVHSTAAPPEVVVPKTADVETSLFNGHVEGKGDQMSEGEVATSSALCEAAPVHTTRVPGLDLIREPGESVTIKEETLEELRNTKLSLEELRSVKLKSFKAEDPTNTFFVKAPMSRPLPSAYMNEKELSMRKRRHEVSPPPKSNPHAYRRNYNSKKTPTPKVEEETPPPVVQTRSRCNKCLAIFSSVEEMKKHEDLNTCSALFGFDSDDES